MYVYDPYGFPIRIPRDLLQALGEHSGKLLSSFELEPIVCDAIDQYMNPAPAPAPAAAPQSVEPSEAGYQWKEVFLPAGTKLRASFDRKPYFAVVEGTQIKYGEHAISPSCFANLQGSGNRNAWKAIWLRLPGSDDWLLADTYRSARKAALARLFAGAAPPARQPAPADSAAVASASVAGKAVASKAVDSKADVSKADVSKAGGSKAVGSTAGNSKAVASVPRSAAVVDVASARTTAARPPEVPVAPGGKGGGQKKSSRSAARRKRRAAKHLPAQT